MILHENQEPSEPLIVEPFGDVQDQALAVRVLSPHLAGAFAGDMLRIRTAVLESADAPSDVIAAYDPDRVAKKQSQNIAAADLHTYYLSASLGDCKTVTRLHEKDKFDLPVDTIAEGIERRLRTVGLAKVTSYENTVELQALDVDPEYMRQSIGSLLLYKALSIYAGHASVSPLSLRDELESELVLSARPARFDTLLPLMLNSLHMTSNKNGEYSAPLRTVNQTLGHKLHVKWPPQRLPE